MVPDPPSRPLLIPLYPPAESADPSFAAPISIVTAQDASEPSTSAATSSNLRPIKSAKPVKRRHWVINRNGPTRTRIKDAGDEDVVPAWKTPREPVATDFGSYATLPSILALENKLQNVGEDLGSEVKLLDVLRRNLDSASPVPDPASSLSDQTAPTEEDSYWRGRATEAETYIRDIVYGGADGLAYARSLAEFLTPSEPVVSQPPPSPQSRSCSRILTPCSAVERAATRIWRAWHACGPVGRGERARPPDRRTPPCPPRCRAYPQQSPAHPAPDAPIHLIRPP